MKKDNVSWFSIFKYNRWYYICILFALCWFRLSFIAKYNTKYLIGCLISQHSNDIWLTFCNDLHSKCKSYLFKYSCKKCSHNRKQFMFDTFCYSQPTSKYVLSLKERHINWIFIYFFIKSACLTLFQTM